MSSFFEKRGNNALNVNTNTQNGKSAAIAITTHGSDLYWAICAIMITATMVFVGLAATKPRHHRIFHYITAAITMVAAVAYFSMASNLGWTPIDVEFQRNNPVVRGVNREIFYVRYIDWFITTPLLLMDLLLTAGMPWPTVLFVILVDEVMIVTGLVGALVKSSYKWGYFAFGCAALAYIVWELVWTARKHASRLGSDIGKAFVSCGSLTAFLWILYPVAWGVCEGGNVISPDSEAVFYGILDVLAKPVFGALLIWGHRGIDPGRLGLHLRDYDSDPAVYANDKHANDYGVPANNTGVIHTGVAGTNNTTRPTDGIVTGAERV
ncbi:hypothetical protein BJ546DRAFT_1065685 [Cryomyces antarcticus]|uniref:Family A G protein-coupled receptor-like protein n=1 Tax=Cryomyces antarcticus TaxID=329879 RepID=A0ABR0LXQ3_9PEZI|nr:hypothetical protein LTR60_003030 [Cryomyces antarcticus]KAK5256150.1 hypothetical protein LTR16_003910 [Cryomyces antarcticus]